jgi:hypothetical protein
MNIWTNKKKVYGFLTQQIADIIPEAVVRQKGTLYDIYNDFTLLTILTLLTLRTLLTLIIILHIPLTAPRLSLQRHQLTQLT